MPDGSPVRVGQDDGASPSDTYAHTGDQVVRRIVYSTAMIAQRVREMGQAITAAYPRGEELLVLGLLKGSFIFLADLVREIERPIMVDFIVAASYGGGPESSGYVRLVSATESALQDSTLQT